MHVHGTTACHATHTTTGTRRPHCIDPPSLPPCPPRPRRPDASVMVAATDDAYVSVESVQAVHRYWVGSELRMVRGGHVSAFLMQQAHFRRAVLDSLNRL